MTNRMPKTLSKLGALKKRFGRTAKKIVTAPLRFVRKGLEKDRAYTQFKEESYRQEYGTGE